MWDFSIGRTLGLLAQTFPFILLRMVVYFGITIAYIVATGAGAAIGYGVGHVSDDPAAFSIGLDSLVRMRERPDRWLVELAGAVERLGPVPTWEANVALAAAADDPAAVN